MVVAVDWSSIPLGSLASLMSLLIGRVCIWYVSYVRGPFVLRHDGWCTVRVSSKCGAEMGVEGWNT